MIKFLDLASQYRTIQHEMDATIHDVISEAAFVGGARNEQFEAAFAAYQQATYAVGVANGTDAIEIALEALALPSDSEVIVPANSFIASSEAVTRSGLRVVFADVDATHYTLDIDDVRSRITPRTAAIIAVHLYGHPCQMDPLKALAQAHGLRVIEDCAQAHGAEYRGRRVGAIGDIGAFSFYPGKNLGAYGDAGAIVTNDGKLAKRCRMIANHGRTAKYDHQFEGRNSRLDGLQAAVLSVKLRHLDSWLARRRSIALRYRRGLSDIPSLVLPGHASDVAHAYHLFVVHTSHRDALMAFLNERGIQTGIHYPIALPKLAAYAYLEQANAPLRANHMDQEILSLPMGEHLSDADVDAVIAAVRTFFATT
jgi:dTDP-4-amino-4,6-dideoxygalactose transaminase